MAYYAVNILKIINIYKRSSCDVRFISDILGFLISLWFLTMYGDVKDFIKEDHRHVTTSQRPPTLSGY